jgi:homoserine dehydrogenase
MSRPLRVAVAGLGTVGAGVLKLLRDNAGIIAARAGRPIKVVAVSARRRRKQRGVSLAGVRWQADALALAGEPDVDVVVELIGGGGGIAKKLCERALAAGKAVVTANKAMLALHGNELAKAAEKSGQALRFEAAVAGGIPIVKALREGLAGNRISRVYGILNGTCNYVLTEMRAGKREFADVLAEAQAKGYAEANPSVDVDGIDAAHKLAILAALAFNCRVDFAGVHAEGIRRVSPVDIAYADEFNYRIKLLAIARLGPHGLEQRVHPCMVPIDTPIAHVDGVFNAVVAEGDFVGRAVFEGRGAGAGPTASAVVADLIDIAAGRATMPFGVPAAALRRLEPAPMGRRVGRYYIRLTVFDRPGVIAAVSAVLRDQRISIESLVQRGRAESAAAPVPVVIITHDAEEAAMRRALDRIGRLPVVVEPPHMIRIENL